MKMNCDTASEEQVTRIFESPVLFIYPGMIYPTIWSNIYDCKHEGRAEKF